MVRVGANNTSHIPLATQFLPTGEKMAKKSGRALVWQNSHSIERYPGAWCVCYCFCFCFCCFCCRCRFDSPNSSISNINNISSRQLQMVSLCKLAAFSMEERERGSTFGKLRQFSHTLTTILFARIRLLPSVDCCCACVCLSVLCVRFHINKHLFKMIKTISVCCCEHFGSSALPFSAAATAVALWVHHY